MHHFCFRKELSFYLLICFIFYLRLCQVFLQLQQVGPPLVAARGSSSRWPVFLWTRGSKVRGLRQLQLRALEHSLRSCGAQVSCSMACGILPWIKPVSPALAGGFFTTEPPGKPPERNFKLKRNYTTQGLWPNFYKNNKWSIPIKCCESLYCSPAAYIMK